jgi:PIN domain nuclease of toxin-antitoxin system
MASVVNLWELVLKMRKQGALLADPVTWWAKYISGNSIPALSVQTTHIETLGSLADLHKDPFDRLLVAQAIAEDLQLVTNDAQLGLYGVSVIW